MEWIAVIKLGGAILQWVLIPLALWLWKTQRDKVKNEEVRAVVDFSVRYAEEVGAREKWSSQQKYDYVWKQVETRWPKLCENRELVDLLIHAGIQAIGAGASAKENN